MDAVKTFCYLNKDMQFTKNKSEAIALAYRFREKCLDGAYCAGSDNQIVEVVFFEPIGHNVTRKESNQIVRIGEKNIILNIRLSYRQLRFLIWTV